MFEQRKIEKLIFFDTFEKIQNLTNLENLGLLMMR